MGTCSFCGDTDVLTRTCNHCGTTTCTEHILPENHDCVALDDRVTNAKHFQSELDAKQRTTDSGQDRERLGTPDPETAAAKTVGPASEPEYDSGPDVALDGSIKTPSDGEGTTSADTHTSASSGMTLAGVFAWPTAAARAIGGRLRSKSVLLVLVLGVLATGQLGLAPIPGLPVDGGQLSGGVGETAGSLANDSVLDTTPADGGAATSRHGFNRSETERRFITYLNEERASRGLQNVSRRTALTRMGENHSRDMAENEYFDHVQPDGDTIQDRYEARGLLPECQLPTGDGSHYPGAENIAETHVNERLLVDWKDGTYTVRTEDDLAYGLFQMWMHSTGHREAMLVASADEVGLGLHITDAGTAYASLELC